MHLKIERRDFLYFILSFFVVLCHNNCYDFYKIRNIAINPIVIEANNLVFDCFSRVAIPLFLFFTGLFYWNGLDSNEDLKRKMKSRAKSVLLVFFIWNIISMLWSYSLSIIPIIKNHIEVRELFTFTYNNIINGLFYYKYNMHNWYLAQLCIFVIISPIVYLIFKNKLCGLLLVLMVFGLYIGGINLPIYLQDYTGIYYFLGSFIGKFYYNEFISFSQNSFHRKWYSILLNVISFFLFQLLAYYYVPEFYDRGLLWLLSSYSFWILINLVSIKYCKSEIYSYSYFIYLSHFIVAPCVNKLIMLFLPKNSFFLLFSLIGGTIISIIIIIVTGHLLKRFFNPIWKLLVGE